MKICLLSRADSIHTKKWAVFLRKKGVKVYLLSLHKFAQKNFQATQLSYPQLPFKLGYFFVVPKIRKILNEIKPDILQAHYASSYGLLAALSNFHPFIVSVWGSDIFDFPRKSPLHRWVIKFVLKRADIITSTSKFMGKEVQKLAPGKKVEIIPFGVDTNLFWPENVIRRRSFKPATLRKKDSAFTIGTARPLKKIYGLEYLIKAFSLFQKKIPNSALEIAGEGAQSNELRSLASSLMTESKVRFLGFIDQTKLASLIRNWDMVVIPSLRESFCVFALEASASGTPIIASRIEGLSETIIETKTGLFFEPKNVDELLNKMLLLYNDKTLRETLGKAGRNFVVRNYDWEAVAPKILEVYKRVLEK